MIKLERTEVMNFRGAIRGARNPMNSWSKSDTVFLDDLGDCYNEPYYSNISEERVDYHGPMPYENGFIIGENDMDLLQRLIKAGTDHRKFMRQIFVSVDVTAPLYWWKEYDTYKVGTVANSTSTMHKIHSKPFEITDFSHDHMTVETMAFMSIVVNKLEEIRLKYMETKSKDYWYDMIQLLPSSYNQTRTLTFTYENLMNMYHARRNHKLKEWHSFCDWVEELPYASQLITGKEVVK